MPIADVLSPHAKDGDGGTSPEIGVSMDTPQGDSDRWDLIDALLDGYRLFDFGARNHRERDVVAAIQQTGLNRENVKVIKKLPLTHYRSEDALNLITCELETSGLGFFDQYLLEWPSQDSNSTAQAWDALIRAKEKNLVRSIGVCNFAPVNVERLITQSSTLPCINQIEMHPHFPLPDQLALHTSLGITTQARMPFGRANHLLCCPVVEAIALQSNKSAAQVILRWHYQRGVIPFTRFSPKHLPPVIQLGLHDFELSEDAMLRISQLALRNGRMYEEHFG
ncbi:aldo/keto reductase [Pseudomonas syringae]|uniref:aldo/keto reductase n=1 Tax=Pseudomonas syringae TaxID=317 RepID=UPI0006ACAD62|nr:aldo/keto reductase [Pseudomonas syringae]